ncbi:MAG: hypothetical protein ACT4QG_16520 [Sporichthyaceae bacterium]
MFRTSIAATTVVLGTALTTGIATATPPYGFATMENVVRGPAVGGATVNVAPGTGAYLGSYALQAGSSTGWRSQPGVSLLALTSGTVRVVQAKGCAAREYTAPDVAVLPAGTIHVGAKDNAEFVGYFDGLPKSIGTPLVDGPAAQTPAGCAGVGTASVGVATTALGSGVWRPIAKERAHGHVAAARSKIPDGADVLMLVIDNVLPGTSTGWYRHAPGIAFQTRGTSETWAATDSGCAKIEENVAGDAVSHVHHDLHLTRVPENSEPATFVGVYWGMANDRSAKPALLNFAEAYDFTPMPPPGCTTF